MTESTDEVAQWWATAIIRMAPGVIELRGRPVQDLIGRVGLTEMIWLMLRGELPEPRQAALLEAALVAGVDHGPHAPSIAAARMAATCGVGLNNAVATGVNLLGDSHGGAGQQCVELLHDVVAAARDARGAPPGEADLGDRASPGARPAARPGGVGLGGGDAARPGGDAARPGGDAARPGGDAARPGEVGLDAAAAVVVSAWRERSPYLPGFGHRFHPVDPRRGPLLALVDDAVAAGVVDGRFAAAARAVEAVLNPPGRRRPVPMNIDGATAVIYAELGFAAPLARGLFVLSRSIGILAHAWEETQSGRRNKGPIPPGILPEHRPAT